MCEQLQVFGTVNDSIVDGPGLRYVVFAQGCPHHCPGCHNPGTHAFEGGMSQTVDALYQEIARNPLLAGVTFSGGEPFAQAKAFAALARALLPLHRSIWVYSGYTWEELTQSDQPDVQALLFQCDVLVDGRFEQAQRSLSLRFCGSRNQRLIDVAASRAQGRVALWTPPAW